MKRVMSLLSILLLMVSVSAMAADPIQDLIDVAVPVNIDGKQPGLEEVKAAVISGCRKRGWIPVVSGPNQITAKLDVRSKHFAEVDITYNVNTYSIVYKSSTNLDYNEEKRKIHRNYNKWVSILSSTIQREFGVNAQGF